MGIRLRVNGEFRTADVPADTPLLYLLRDDMGLLGPKFGCGLGQCGACTVHVDGRAVRSCITLAEEVKGKSVVTLEGLGSEDDPHPLQDAFILHQAAQCGYCTNGMIMTAAAYLAENTNPTEAEIRTAMSANLCRCGTHTRIIKAIRAAAGQEQKTGDGK